MKKIRNIDKEERDILLNNRLRSIIPMGTLFYIMGFLLPFLTCMLITGDFKYLYIFLVGIIILLMVVLIYPMIYYNHLQTAKIECFDSIILSCKRGDIYYYKVEIEGLDKDFSEIKYPVLHKMKLGDEVTVVMMFGKNNPKKYLLIDKNKKRLLSSKRTRFDLID